MGNTKKNIFLEGYYLSVCQGATYTKLVVAIKLDTGATELIFNTEQIESKIEYYKNNYDDELRLKRNNDIYIIDWLFA
jgi:hypothetical protein